MKKEPEQINKIADQQKLPREGKILEDYKDVELSMDEEFVVINRIKQDLRYDLLKAKISELVLSGIEIAEATKQAEKEITLEDIDIDGVDCEPYFRQAREQKYYANKTNAYFHNLDSSRGLQTIKNDVFIHKVIERLYEIVDIECLPENFDKVFTPNNIRQFNLLKWYFTQDPEFEKAGFSFKKGILLFGNIGCGKSTLMEIFKKNPFRSYVMVSCRTVADAYKSDGANGVSRYYHYQANKFPPVYFGQKELGYCFDDLGTEETKAHFGDKLNVMTEIILNWYDKKNTKGLNNIHITTNLSGKEIQQYYGSRASSRMREMFNIITFDSSAKDLRK